MTRDQADYAIVHLQRAITALGAITALATDAPHPRYATMEDAAASAKEDIAKALAFLPTDSSAGFDPYAMRPGLNKHTEDSVHV